MAAPRHFLDLDELDGGTLRAILDSGKSFKSARAEATKREAKPLDGRTLAMIFEKPSTRTRVSFEVGMRQLGGEAVVMERTGSQLGRGETIADTARVLSRYVDAIMIRTTSHSKLLDLAAHATVPVINGLTDRTHPCQLMADVMTFEEHRGPIEAGASPGPATATTWPRRGCRPPPASTSSSGSPVRRSSCRRPRRSTGPPGRARRS
jgi:ornithine carbamoyltransferase